MLHLFFIFVLVVCISLSMYSFNENLESSSGGRKSGWPTNRKSGMRFSLVSERDHTPRETRGTRRWVRSLGPNPSFWLSEKEGVDPCDQPQSSF